MKSSWITFVVLACSSLVICQLPQVIVEEFEGVFKGEGFNCRSTSAKVQVNSEQVHEVDQGLVTALSRAVAESVLDIENAGTTESAVAAAELTGELILEVIAQAEATVSAQINSPNPGCWAIAFGRAQAVAVAQATVTAVAQAFSSALSLQAQATNSGFLQGIETDGKVAVEKVALMLSDGSGGGRQSGSRSVIAEAKAKVVNCALAKSFASVGQGVAEASVLASLGCLDSKKFSVRGITRSTATQNCDCQTTSSDDSPSGCGLYGDQASGDYICYLKFPKQCSCAQQSNKYTAKPWRYCGQTLEKMQSWLKLSDKSNNISPYKSLKSGGFGYCDNIAPSRDVSSTPGNSSSVPQNNVHSGQNPQGFSTSPSPSLAQPPFTPKNSTSIDQSGVVQEFVPADPNPQNSFVQPTLSLSLPQNLNEIEEDIGNVWCFSWETGC